VWHPRDIAFGNHRLRAFDCGDGAPGAPVIVMLHGLGHWTQAAWDRLAPQFAATHRIVAFDLPGFGASDKPDRSYTLEYFTSAVRAVVASYEIPHFGLIGHSLGGLIAANYAAYHPDRVRALALLDPAGFLRTPHLVARVVGSRIALRLRVNVSPPGGFVRASLRKATYDPGTMTADESARATELVRDGGVTRAFFRVYAGSAEHLFRMRALHARLRGYGGPTSIVWGRDDRYIPARALRAARRVYPHAQTLVIDRCGHCPAIEYPELLAGRLRANGF